MNKSYQNQLISMIVGIGVGLLGANMLPGCSYKEKLDIKVRYQLHSGEVVDCAGYNGILTGNDKVNMQVGCARWEVDPEAYGRMNRLKEWMIVKGSSYDREQITKELLIHSDADNDGHITEAEAKELERLLDWPGHRNR